MTTDKNNKLIKIGDIVRIENSPIKNDNGVYVVEQDGTSEFYSGTDLTLLKVAKTKTGYRLSHTKNNIAFYPLRNFSNKYKYTKEEMAAATIEIIKEAQPQAVEFKEVDRRVYEEMQKPYIYIEIKKGDDAINVSYLTKQIELAKAFLSNIEIVEGEEIKVKEMDQDNRWGRRSYIDYEVVKGEPVQTAPATAEEEPQEEPQVPTALIKEIER